MDLVYQLDTTTQPPTLNENNLGFGKQFSRHMFMMEWNEEQGWHDARIVPFGPLTLSPAAPVLHYAQEVFEGLKAYRQPDGEIGLFRTLDNCRRLNNSAIRCQMPTIDEKDSFEYIQRLVDVDRAYVPHKEGNTLYIRPTMIAVGQGLGASAAKNYLYFIILSPSGAYYARGVSPVRLKVEEKYVRAVKGGMGEAKTGGNYAASFKATSDASRQSFDQVLWLDGKENRYCEEAGAMNIMFVNDGRIHTTSLTGSILPGITRASVLQLADDFGIEVVERPIAIEELVAWSRAGTLTEAFGTGTAAVISPIGELNYRGEAIVPGDGNIGPISRRLYDTLTGIQFGKLPDPHGWTSLVPRFTQA